MVTSSPSSVDGGPNDNGNGGIIDDDVDDECSSFTATVGSSLLESIRSNFTASASASAAAAFCNSKSFNDSCLARLSASSSSSGCNFLLRTERRLMITDDDVGDW
jgi:hypothetical protein